MRTVIANLDSASIRSIPARCAVLETSALVKRKPVPWQSTQTP